MKASLLLVLALAFVAPRAAAQDVPCPRRPDALVLAILTVHEAGWDAEADMRAIRAVLVGVARREGVRFGTAACLHSGRALRGETTRSWVAGLNERGTSPASWPSVVMTRRGGTTRVEPHARWATYRARWLSTLETAQRVLAEELEPFLAVCAPSTWGSDLDVSARERLSDRSWVDLPCGETRNRYGHWLSPSE